MKRLGVMSVVLLVGACVAPKEMNQTWGVGVRTGVASQDGQKVDRSFALGGVTASYFPAPQVEIQGQFDGGVSNTENEGKAKKNADVNSTQWAGRLMALYNIDTGGGLVPYVGVGAGFARTKFMQTNDPSSDKGLDMTWGAQAGLKLFLSESTALDGSLQYNRLVQDEALGEDVDEFILFLGLSHIF